MLGPQSGLLESGAVDALFLIKADPENPIANRTVVSLSRAVFPAKAEARYVPITPPPPPKRRGRPPTTKNGAADH